MLDLSSLDQPSGQSWADMVDEEFESTHSDTDDNEASSPSTNAAATAASHDPSNRTNTSSPPTTNGASRSSSPLPEPAKPDEPESSGVVWRIPDAKQRQEQQSILQMLIERRKNADKLDSSQQKSASSGSGSDDERPRRGSLRRRQEMDDEPQANRSSRVDSWRRPVGKYERIPVRPAENNQISQWASYSQTLQEEFKEEQEEARREYIRRFGSEAANGTSSGSTPHVAAPTPIEIKISADGPSDWADDIPMDDDDDGGDAGAQGAADTEDVLADQLHRVQLEGDSETASSSAAAVEQPAVHAPPVSTETTETASVAAADDMTTVHHSSPPEPPSWGAFAESEAAAAVAAPPAVAAEQTTSEAHVPANGERAPGELKWAAFAQHESRKLAVKAPIYASPSVSTGTSASCSSSSSNNNTVARDAPDNGVLPCSTSTDSNVEPSAPTPAPVKRKLARSARAQIMGHLLKNENRPPRASSSTASAGGARRGSREQHAADTKAADLQAPSTSSSQQPPVSVSRQQPPVSVSISNPQPPAPASSQQPPATSVSNPQPPAPVSSQQADHRQPRPAQQQQPSNGASSSWQLFAQEHSARSTARSPPRSSHRY